MKNYYDLLEISEKSTKEEIQKAFRKLAKKYHPDVNNGNSKIQEKFKEIKEAYEVLNDEKKRKQYDESIKVNKNHETCKTNNINTEKVSFDFSQVKNSFESFFGFDAKTGEVKKEEKLKNKNPIDTTNLFEKFMGFKK